jgi:hypothetical protein
MGTGSVPQGIKRPGRECKHSPPHIAKVKNKWIYNFTSPYALIACTETTFLCNKTYSLVFTFLCAHAFLMKCNNLHYTAFYAITFPALHFRNGHSKTWCPVMSSTPPKSSLRFNVNHHR